MPLPGTAFLAIWHDIDPPAWDAYREWHTREHMPERVGIPGFRMGARLINHDLPRYRYGTVYAGDALEVFSGPDYLERLNNPTSWTLEVQPAFRNFLRVACERLASAGAGVGGAVATVRLDFDGDDGEARLRAGASALAATLLAIPGACAVDIGLARPEYSDVKTRETELRPAMQERGFDAVVLVEGSGRPELETVAGAIEAAILGAGCGLADPQTLVYNLAYRLGEDEVAP